VISALSLYRAVALVWAVVAVAVVPYLLVRPAPYGRHARPGWGRAVPARLAWLLMEIPSPLGMVLFFAFGDGGPVAGVFLLLWLLHYVYRALVFPFLLPVKARPMPITVLLSGAFFNVVNAYLNGAWLFFLAPPRTLAWLASPRFVLGAVLFLVGLGTHVLADRKLQFLRRSAEGYGIPQGGLFRYLSCPNYFGEIVEWAGFALATWSPGGLIFALWTAANLVPRAIRHHQWYREKFPAYPSSRRAVVPFLL
jgi:hypothetical protein